MKVQGRGGNEGAVMFMKPGSERREGEAAGKC